MKSLDEMIFDDMVRTMNPFYDNHLFNAKDLERAKLDWRDRLKCIFHPMKVMIGDNAVWYYKARRGAYYFFKSEPMFGNAVDSDSESKRYPKKGLLRKLGRSKPPKENN